jgi:hypothetical protein
MNRCKQGGFSLCFLAFLEAGKIFIGRAAAGTAVYLPVWE